MKNNLHALAILALLPLATISALDELPPDFSTSTFRVIDSIDELPKDAKKILIERSRDVRSSGGFTACRHSDPNDCSYFEASKCDLSGIVNHGQQYNSTDVIECNRPQRELLLAGTIGDQILVFIQQGGHVVEFFIEIYDIHPRVPKVAFASGALWCSSGQPPATIEEIQSFLQKWPERDVCSY